MLSCGNTISIRQRGPSQRMLWISYQWQKQFTSIGKHNKNNAQRLSWNCISKGKTLQNNRLLVNLQLTRPTVRWIIQNGDEHDLAAQSVSTETSYLCVNTADKNQPVAAVLQVHISDKARHIPGGWNFIRSIFTTISCQPTMTDRPGIPLITKLLQSGNFFSPQFLDSYYIYSNGHANLKKTNYGLCSLLPS